MKTRFPLSVVALLISVVSFDDLLHIFLTIHDPTCGAQGDEGRRTATQDDHPSLVPPPPSTFSFLKSMRRFAPESKDWG